MKDISIIELICVGYDRKQFFPSLFSVFIFSTDPYNFVNSSLTLLICWRATSLLLCQSLFACMNVQIQTNFHITYIAFAYLKVKEKHRLDMIYCWHICAAYFTMWKHFSLGSWGKNSVSLAIQHYFSQFCFVILVT